MLESEYKVLLTYEEYACILQHLAVDLPTVAQINYFYDTDDFQMNEIRITCRIREKDGKFTTMFKEHNPQGERFNIENVICVSDKRDDTVFAHIGAKIQGSLRTERIILYSDDYIEAVIDKNIYLGCTDYELEVEYKVGAEEPATLFIHNIAELLKSHCILTQDASLFSRMVSTKSKSERFYDRKKFLIKMETDKFIQVTTCPE